jgi:4-aminobutyrate aminotransferase-like enzyme
LRQAITSLEQRGIKPAAYIVDTIFSSDGLPRIPEGYLRAAAGIIRAAGGLFIADEVQPGFGRTGAHFWGFESHGLTPDIVTMGKPMGNGHPVSALVTSHDVLEPFEKKARYFNTFGGNPVSCAAAAAVLDVIEQEALQDNAVETSAHLERGLREMMGRHASIGDIRGSGLFIGLDIVADRESRVADGRRANNIVNGLKQRGVLVGCTGPHGNVIKLRPPMVFKPEHADFLLEQLDETLASS